MFTPSEPVIMYLIKVMNVWSNKQYLMTLICFCTILSMEKLCSLWCIVLCMHVLKTHIHSKDFKMPYLIDVVL